MRKEPAVDYPDAVARFAAAERDTRVDPVNEGKGPAGRTEEDGRRFAES